MNKYVITLILSFMVIFLLGLLMVFNTTAAEVLDPSSNESTHIALIKQMLYAVLAVIVGLGVRFIGYQNFIKLSPFFLGFATFLLVAVLIPGIGQQLNGARRWINVFGNSLQPSEFVKYLIPLFYVHKMKQAPEDKKLLLKYFLKTLGYIAVPVVLILIEPDNGTVAIIFASLFMVFILTRLKTSYWLVPLLVLITGGVVAASRMPHVSDRIRVYMNPEADILGKGHQSHQARIAAGSGKLWGKGIGQSMQKLYYLPEARSDYIAAIYAEEFGFIGIFVLVTLYMGMAVSGFMIAAKAKSLDGFYIATIMTFLICFQAFLNLGVVSGILPSKGTNLPFFSHGGSSLLANFFALFLILNVAKQDKYSTIYA